MTSHKEQPAVDTSAETLTGFAAEARKMASTIYIAVEKDVADDISARLRRFADAFTALAAHPAEPEKFTAAARSGDEAGSDQPAAASRQPDQDAGTAREAPVQLDKSTAVKPAEPAGMELETTAEELAFIARFFVDDPTLLPARILRDLARWRARADALAVGLLNMQEERDRYMSMYEAETARAEKAEAALKQPVSDEEVEKLRSQCDDALGALDSAMSEQTHRYHSDPPPDADYAVAFAVLKKVEEALHKVYFALPALSTHLRDAQARGKGMEEALLRMSGPPWTARLARTDLRTDIERQACDLQATIEKLGGHPLLTDASLSADRAARFLGKWHDEGEPGRAALSRPKGSAST